MAVTFPPDDSILGEGGGVGPVFMGVQVRSSNLIVFCTPVSKKYVKLYLESIIPFSILYLN